MPKLPASVHPEAARALGRLRAKAHVGAVAPLLGGDVAQRAAAAKALGEMNAAGELDAVSELLADAHPTVRREALVAVGRLAPVPARQERAVAALKDPDPSVRTAAAGILQRHPRIDAVPALFALLADPHTALRDAARDALASPASPEMRDLVTDRAAAMLNQAERPTRIDGSFLVGRLRSDKNAARHVSFLEITEPPYSNDAVLMAQVVESMGQIGIKEAGPSIAEMARRTPTTVLVPNPKNFMGDDAQAAVFVAGGKLREPGVLPEARRLLAAPGGQPAALRGAAVFALGTITDADDAEANAQLKKIAEGHGEYATARYEAIKALVRRKTPGVQEMLQRVSSTSTDPMARFAAHWAVERLTGQRRPYVPPTTRWQQETSITDLLSE